MTFMAHCGHAGRKRLRLSVSRREESLIIGVKVCRGTGYEGFHVATDRVRLAATDSRIAALRE